MLILFLRKHFGKYSNKHLFVEKWQLNQVLSAVQYMPNEMEVTRKYPEVFHLI